MVAVAQIFKQIETADNFLKYAKPGTEEKARERARRFDATTWRLEVTGQVERAVSLTWKNVKWVQTFELIASDKRGFWELRGYHNRADPWLEERYSYQEA